ncbi:MAG TPA: hypothetical protein VLI05_02745 [Candidatus Saccharimonadia bacterium]|nr:hypothetical protein [Candidatus Saccharimonadia bacterium]
MAKKTSFKFQLRDVLMAVVLIALAVTNFVWYQTTQGLSISAENAVKGWVYSETQISKLKLCIDQGTKPCDISTTTQP